MFLSVMYKQITVMPGYWLQIYFFEFKYRKWDWRILGSLIAPVLYLCKIPNVVHVLRINERWANWQVVGYGSSILTICVHFALSVQTYATEE